MSPANPTTAVAAPQQPAPPPRFPTFRTGAVLCHEFVGGLLDAIIPQTCFGCDVWIRSGGDRVCGTCRAQISNLIALPACPRCARSMRPESIFEKSCARCEHESFWNVRGIVRVGSYDPPLRGMLLALKYSGRERNADFLADLLVARLQQAPWGNAIDVFVPIPMHRLRRWQRPCDHAEVLARAVGHRLGVPVRRAAVRRVRYAPSQTRALTRNQRFEQVAGCFGPTRQPGVEGKTVCIVDNLLVSGATLHEVSKVLRAAGAQRIYAAVVSRSVMPGDFQAASAALTASTESAC